jgi:hypothetical protein
MNRDHVMVDRRELRFRLNIHIFDFLVAQPCGGLIVMILLGRRRHRLVVDARVFNQGRQQVCEIVVGWGLVEADSRFLKCFLPNVP